MWLESIRTGGMQADEVQASGTGKAVRRKGEPKRVIMTQAVYGRKRRVKGGEEPAGKRGGDGTGKRRRGAALLMLALALQLAGCSATELENRCFPMIAAVDYKDGQVDFAYGFPQPSQDENTDGGAEQTDVPMKEGASFREAYESYGRELDKKADCNHLKVIVLSEALLEQEEVFSQMIEYLQKSELFPRNTFVCVTEDIGELMETENNLSTDIGSYLETFLQTHEKERDAELVNLGTVLDESENHIKALQLPYLKVEDDAILWDGDYVLKFSY